MGDGDWEGNCAWLRAAGIDPAQVNSSFFDYPVAWVCPVCEAPKTALLHQRKNGIWFSGIEHHHFGPALPGSDFSAYLTQPSVPICYRCNSREAIYRKKHGLSEVMSVRAMRCAFGYDL